MKLEINITNGICNDKYENTNKSKRNWFLYFIYCLLFFWKWLLFFISWFFLLYHNFYTKNRIQYNSGFPFKIFSSLKPIISRFLSHLWPVQCLSHITCVRIWRYLIIGTLEINFLKGIQTSRKRSCSIEVKSVLF